MKVLFDTNILLDAMAKRQPWDKEARSLIRLVAKEAIQGYVTANSLTDIYYLIRKHLSDRQAREALSSIFQIFRVIDLEASDCQKALTLDMADYEDALVLTLAQRHKMDCILSRDQALIKENTCPKVLEPQVFLKQFNL